MWSGTEGFLPRDLAPPGEPPAQKRGHVSDSLGIARAAGGVNSNP